MAISIAAIVASRFLCNHKQVKVIQKPRLTLQVVPSDTVSLLLASSLFDLFTNPSYTHVDKMGALTSK